MIRRNLGYVALAAVFFLSLGFVSADLDDGNYGCRMGSAVYGTQYGSYFGFAIQLLVVAVFALIVVWMMRQNLGGRK